MSTVEWIMFAGLFLILCAFVQDYWRVHRRTRHIGKHELRKGKDQ